METAGSSTENGEKKTEYGAAHFSAGQHDIFMQK